MGLFSKLVSKFSSLTGAVPATDLADLESELLTADLGPTFTREVMEAARKGRGDLRTRIEEVLRAGLSGGSRLIQLSEHLLLNKRTFVQYHVHKGHTTKTIGVISASNQNLSSVDKGNL